MSGTVSYRVIEFFVNFLWWLFIIYSGKTPLSIAAVVGSCCFRNSLFSVAAMWSAGAPRQQFLSVAPAAQNGRRSAPPASVIPGFQPMARLSWKMRSMDAGGLVLKHWENPTIWCGLFECRCFVHIFRCFMFSLHPRRRSRWKMMEDTWIYCTSGDRLTNLKQKSTMFQTPQTKSSCFNVFFYIFYDNIWAIYCVHSHNLLNIYEFMNE